MARGDDDEEEGFETGPELRNRPPAPGEYKTEKARREEDERVRLTREREERERDRRRDG